MAADVKTSNGACRGIRTCCKSEVATIFSSPFSLSLIISLVTRFWVGNLCQRGRLGQVSNSKMKCLFIFGFAGPFSSFTRTGLESDAMPTRLSGYHVWGEKPLSMSGYGAGFEFEVSISSLCFANPPLLTSFWAILALLLISYANPPLPFTRFWGEEPL
jgi:hypothetical protein